MKAGGVIPPAFAVPGSSRTQEVMSNHQPRKPEGIPTGGQFDTMTHAEPSLTLQVPDPGHDGENRLLFDETPPTKLTYEDPFPGRKGTEEEWDDCRRCGGEGTMTQFQSVFDGVCFECQGGKGSMQPIAVLRRREQGRIRRVNQAEAALYEKRMLHNRNYTRAMEMNPAAEKWAEEIGNDAFMANLWEKAFKYELSDKQLAAIGNSFDRQRAWDESKEAAKAEAEANAVEVPEGRYQIIGEVLSTDVKDHEFGSTLKMTVKDDRGFKVYGTVPSALFDALIALPGNDGLSGRKVTFTAGIKPGREKGFGFFSRPGKASLQ